MGDFAKLSSLLCTKSKKNLFWLILLSVFLSTVEVIGISAIMPFIDVSINFGNITNNQYYYWFYKVFKFEREVNFVITFGFILLVFYIFRGGVNLFHSYAITNFTQRLYSEISNRLFQTYLSMPYEVFVTKNSSYLSKSIITEASLISIVIRDVLVMLSEILVVLFLYVLMLIASWKITLVFTVILTIKLFFLVQTVSKRIKFFGKTRANSQADFYESINRVFGDFKYIKLKNSQGLQDIQNNFRMKVDMFSNASAKHQFFSAFPRLFIETTGFSLIILLLMTLLYIRQDNIAYILPTLSLFVLALYRLLPSVNRIVTGYNSLMYYHQSISIVDSELKTIKEDLGNSKVIFENKIELIGVCFSYQNKLVLSDINLTINKGEKIAFIGESGSGKSTLVDIIIGLYRPKTGVIKIDDVEINKSNLQNWRSQVGYIPQQVYLFDGTVADNVCFGRKVDANLLKKVLKQANIFDFFQTKKGVQTIVGEGGIQLSGGQKQRIAIARALYGNPETLILDEATSALDEATEAQIMHEIYRISKGKTLLIVAHRMSTIKACDKVYKINNSTLKI